MIVNRVNDICLAKEIMLVIHRWKAYVVTTCSLSHASNPNYKVSRFELQSLPIQITNLL